MLLICMSIAGTVPLIICLLLLLLQRKKFSYRLGRNLVFLSLAGYLIPFQVVKYLMPTDVLIRTDALANISYYCSRSKFLAKLLKTFGKTFREIFPVFISTKRREKPSAFFDNNFVNNAYFSEAASSSSSHLASSSSKAPISSRMTCLCLWSS